MGKVFLSVLLILFFLPFLIFLICPAVNDIALQGYKSEVLRGLELPVDTEMVETISGCGNSSGTGNHTEMYVAVLVKTGLTDREFLAFFPDALHAAKDGASTPAMQSIGLSFSHTVDSDGYYIIEFAAASPCSDFDLRGH